MQRPYRLRRNQDFARVRREGRVYRHPLMLLSLSPNGLPHNRYGFITSKQLGNAVIRNRVRRVLREAVRQLHPQLKPGFDIVFIARADLVGRPFGPIRRTVQELCDRAGIVTKEDAS